jgi:hypothetical protein
MNEVIVVLQNGSSVVSACRNNSQRPDASFAPAESCVPRPRGASTTVAPAAAARRRVSSLDPPSTTMISTAIVSRASPSASIVSLSLAPAFKVGMITLRSIAFRPFPGALRTAAAATGAVARTDSDLRFAARPITNH